MVGNIQNAMQRNGCWDTCLQRIVDTGVVVFDLKVAERQYDFAQCWSDDFVHFVLVVVVVLRIVRRADRAARSLERLFRRA